MSKIIIKNSSTAGKVPLLTDLVAGELAVNTFDGKLFLKKNDGVAESIIEIGSADDAEIESKADKVEGAVVGNFAALDADGNLTDSGYTSSSFATSLQGLAADTAVQPGDNVSDLVNNVGYLSSASSINDLADVNTAGILAGHTLVWNGTAFVPTGSTVTDAPVDGVAYGRQDASWVPVATGAQGALADSALQSGDNVSELVNDAGYLEDLTTSSIGTLSDVNITNVVFGSILKWNGTMFVAADDLTGPGGGIPEAPIDGFMYGRQDGTWLKTTPEVADDGVLYGRVSTGGVGSWAPTATAAQGALADTALQSLATLSINELMDVDTAGIAVDQILKWNGTLFMPADDAGANIDISVKADKVVGAVDGNFAGLDDQGNLIDSLSNALSFATAAQGLLADSALQSGDNVSALANDVGYLLDAASDTFAYGRQDAAWVQVATAAQGALADSALQPADNVSELTNDANYVADAASDTFAYGRQDAAWVQVATAAQGALADSALQSGDNITELNNDAGYLLDASNDGVSYGRLNAAWAPVASAAQGALADSALQAGDNVSDLQNDAGYMTDLTTSSIDSLMDVNSAGITDGQILQWNAAGSAFVPANYVPGFADAVADATPYGRQDNAWVSVATTAQGALADSALQSGDNVSELANDAGYIGDAVSDGISYGRLDANWVQVASAAQGALADSALQSLATLSINELMDVDTAGIAVDQILKWNGTVFIGADDAGASIDLTVKADKVVGAVVGNFAGLDVDGNLTDSGFASASFATTAQGALADTALQSGDNVSELANDVGYLLDAASDGIAYGRQDAGWVPVASEAQGALAGTAVQPGDNVSELTNDAGYMTDLTTSSIDSLSDVNSAGVTDGQILQWNGLSSAFVPVNYVPGFADAVSDGTAYGRQDAAWVSVATGAQGALADSALQAGDNVSDLQNDANYIGDAASDTFAYGRQDAAWVQVATAAQGALATSALQPGDNISELTNDAAYLLDAASDGVAYGRQDAAWVSVATAAQGALADSALQSGDNVSELANDANYLTDLSTMSIDSLADVDITTVAITTGQILKWDGTNFVGADEAVTDITGKADIVAGAVEGNFAGLDAEGNLTDSGFASGSFATAAQGALAASALQDLTASSINELADVDTTGIVADQILKWNGTAFVGADDISSSIDISGKADKVGSAVDGHFAGLDVDGNLTDSGMAPDSFASAAQGALADTALQSLATLSINELMDVDTAGILNGQVLKWNGTLFMPADDISGTGGVPEAPIDTVVYGRQDGGWVAVATSAQGALADSALQDLTASSINDLADVDTTGILNGQVLKWNGSAFIAADDISGTGGVPEAPIDTFAYGRQDAAWVQVATSAQGALADSALQAGDNISELTNDAAYLIDAASDGVAYGRQDGGWVAVATGAQGALAGTAVQPGQNVSVLNNDAGYLVDLTTSSIDSLSDVNSAGVTDGQILQWDEAGSAFVPTDYVPGLEDAVADGNAYGRQDNAWVAVATSAQGALAATSVQPGQNVSVLVNDAGYLTDLTTTSIDSLSDVNSAGALDGQILQWSDTELAFVPADNAGGLEDAVADGTPYGRQDNAWVKVASEAQGLLADTALQDGSVLDGGEY